MPYSVEEKTTGSVQWESKNISKSIEKVSVVLSNKKNYVLLTKVQTMSEHQIIAQAPAVWRQDAESGRERVGLILCFCDQYRHHYDYHHPAITISFLSTCCVSAYFNHELLFILMYSLVLRVFISLCFLAHNDICVLFLCSFSAGCRRRRHHHRYKTFENLLGGERKRKW